MAGCRRRSATGMIMYIALLVYSPSWLGCHALQAARGPVRIVRGRRSSSRVPTKGGSGEGGNSNKERRGVPGGGGAGGGGGGTGAGRGPGSNSTSGPHRSFHTPVGTSSNIRIGGMKGQRKSTHKKMKRSYSRGSMSVMARMRRKVRWCYAVRSM